MVVVLGGGGGGRAIERAYLVEMYVYVSMREWVVFVYLYIVLHFFKLSQ